MPRFSIQGDFPTRIAKARGPSRQLAILRVADQPDTTCWSGLKQRHDLIAVPPSAAGLQESSKRRTSLARSERTQNAPFCRYLKRPPSVWRRIKAHPIGGTLEKMIDGRRTKNNRGIVHKNGVDNVNRDLDNQNFEGNCANCGLSPTPFYCAKTVSELDLLEPPGLLFERKQIPRFVVNIRILRIAMEPLEATRLPYK